MGQNCEQPKSESSDAAAQLGAGSPDDRWFRAVANYTNDWESWHAPDGRLLWVNPAVERMTGYSIAECFSMIDYPLMMVAHYDRERISKLLNAARDKTSGEFVDFRSLHRNGEMRWMSLSWQPMYEDGGGYLGIRTSIRDVTERYTLREQLRLHAEHLEQLVQERTAKLRQLEDRQRKMEKLAALGQLAAGVAHEINNPLAGMRNAFELIKSSFSTEHEHYELLELIDREIERISAIILQMYQLYRRNPQKASAFSLTRIVGEVVYLLESAASKRGVKLHNELTNDGINVHLAEGEVKQILYNLLRNAIQASPAGEVVDIKMREMDDEVVIRIRDRGPGISEDVLQRMFDPFFTTKTGDAESGMGLGLSVSRSLIEAMGGSMDVSSEAGHGTYFSAVFPRSVDTQQAPIDE